MVAKAFLHQWWICQPSPLTQVGSILSKTTSLIISTKCHIDSYNLHSLYFKWWRWKASAIQKSTFLLSRRGCRLWRLAKLAVPSTEFHETLHRYVDPNQTLQWVELSFNLRGQFLHFLPLRGYKYSVTPPSFDVHQLSATRYIVSWQSIHGEGYWIGITPLYRKLLRLSEVYLQNHNSISLRKFHKDVRKINALSETFG